MALTDINFEETNTQASLFELLVGTLYAPNDMTWGSENMFPVHELPEAAGGNIFIMSE